MEDVQPPGPTTGGDGELLYDAALEDPSQDRLGRAPFAARLADAIRRMDADLGFVFALNGPWGSGKTTVLNFALSSLDRDKQILVVRFNPWWFSGTEQLLQQFFDQLRGALGSPDAPAQLRTIYKRLEQLGKILTVASWIPVLGSIASRAKGPAGWAARTAMQAADSAANVHALRRSIDEALKGQSNRIVIVMDDIDRLTADETREILQVVKAVADFPKTIYLLVFDRDAVTAALDLVSNGRGADYLEKIVQATFHLPPLNRAQLQSLFLEQLDEVLVGTPLALWDATEWGNLYFDGIDPLIRTPRDVKRIVNEMRLAYPLVRGEVNPIDFVGIQALRTFAPKAADFVQASKELLAGASQQDDNSDARRQLFAGQIGSLPDRQRAAADAILAQLFPRFRVSRSFRGRAGGGSYGSDWLPEWRRKNRICSPEIFDRYFFLEVPSGDISNAELQSILALAADPASFANELRRLAQARGPDGTSRVRLLLERMQDYTAEEIADGQIEPILAALYDAGDELLIPGDYKGMFDIGNDMRILRITNQLLKRLTTQQARFEMLQRVLEKGSAVTMIADLVAVLAQEQGERSSGPSRPEAEWLVSAENLLVLKQTVLAKIRGLAARRGTSPRMPLLLADLAELGSEAEAQEWARNVIQQDEGLANLLTGFLGRSQSAGLSDRVSRSTWKIDLPTLKRFLTEELEPIAERCESILSQPPSWLSGQQRLALTTVVEQVRAPQKRDDGWDFDQ